RSTGRLHETASLDDVAHVVYAVEVREVSPVRNPGEEQVALLPRPERPDFGLEPQRVRAMERDAEQRLLRAQSHLAHCHGHDELEVRPHRGTGVEVGGERYAHAGLEELPGGRVRQAEEERGPGQE